MYNYIENRFGEDDVEHHMIFETFNPNLRKKCYEVKSCYVDKFVVWLIDEERFAISTSIEKPDNEIWDFPDYNDLVEKLLVYEQSSECLELAKAYEEEMRKFRETNPSRQLNSCSEF